MASSLRICFIPLASLMFLGMMAGCNILGPAYVFLAGPPKIPAEYDLDRLRTVAVVIDDPDSIVPSMGYRRVMLATAQELLAHNPDPSDDEIREAISGNLSRSTGYEYIINAIRSAAAKRRADQTEAA